MSTYQCGWICYHPAGCVFDFHMYCAVLPMRSMCPDFVWTRTHTFSTSYIGLDCDHARLASFASQSHVGQRDLRCAERSGQKHFSQAKSNWTWLCGRLTWPCQISLGSNFSSMIGVDSQCVGRVCEFQRCACFVQDSTSQHCSCTRSIPEVIAGLVREVMLVSLPLLRQSQISPQRSQSPGKEKTNQKVREITQTYDHMVSHLLK